VTSLADAAAGPRWIWRARRIEYLEALVLRRIESGRIEAYNASALFIL
jgi:hypothetical protein